MATITQIINDSCFIKVVWDNNDSESINKSDVKFSVNGTSVFIGDNSGDFYELKFAQITSPATGSASALLTAIKTFADTNPCSSGGGGGGIPTTGTPYKLLQYDVNGDIQQVNILTDDTGIPIVTLVNGSLKFQDDLGDNNLQLSSRQLINPLALGQTTLLDWSHEFAIALPSVIGNGSFANDAAAGAFGLVSGDLYYTNVAGDFILKIKS